MSEWAKWLIAGLLSIVFGALALANAVAVSLAVVWVTGSLLLVTGALQTLIGVADEGGWNKFFSIMLGVLTAILGLSFMKNPFEGTMSITAVIALFIAAAGATRLFSAFRMRQTRYFWIMLLSGALSILLAAYIFANFQQASERLLGIMLGIELLFNGAALTILGLFLRAHSDEY